MAKLGALAFLLVSRLGVGRRRPSGARLGQSSRSLVRHTTFSHVLARWSGAAPLQLSSGNAGSEWLLIQETHEVCGAVAALHEIQSHVFIPGRSRSARTSFVVRALPAFGVCDRVPLRSPVPSTVSEFGSLLCLGACFCALPSMLKTCWCILVNVGLLVQPPV